jgi:Methyltransferase domain
VLVIPEKFYLIPDELAVVKPPASEEELLAAQATRKSFLFSDKPMPFLVDIVRAFRLLKNAERYLEVGIYDRGNLPYVATLMQGRGLLIGIDIEPQPERDRLVGKTIRPTQEYCFIHGNSISSQTLQKVSEKLGDKKLDAVFIDGGHDAQVAMADFANYVKYVREGGFVLFHDSLWEGTEQVKGVADALEAIDKLYPIYIIRGNNPPYRFIRNLNRTPQWGVVGIHVVGS